MLILNKYSKVISNSFFLLLIKGISFVIPLILLPYLLRVIGVDLYGVIVFSNALIMYFIIFTDYSFNLSATAQISRSRANKPLVNEIFSTIFFVKLLIFAASLIIFLILITFVKFFQEHWLIYVLSFLGVFGHVLMPVWFFQGIEKMHALALFNIFPKVIFTICIFIYVKEPIDFYLVPLFTSLSLVVSGIAGLISALFFYNIKFLPPSTHFVKKVIIDGWEIFTSKIFVSIYTNTVTFFLGFVASLNILGSWGVAERIINSSKGLIDPFSQALYPSVSEKISKNKNIGISYAMGFGSIVILMMLCISLGVYFFSNEIIFLFMAESNAQAILFLKILSPLPFLVAISNLLGVQLLLNLNLKKVFLKIISISALIGIGTGYWLITYYQGLGASITMLLIEIIVTIVMILYMVKNVFWKK